MGLLEVLQEQASFGFTGRVNLILLSGQFIGSVLIRDGLVVSASYRGMSGKKALMKSIFDDVDIDSEKFKIVPEPELIEDCDVKFKENVLTLQKEAQQLYKNFKDAKKYRPPANVKLLLNGDFIKAGDSVTSEEFELMSVMTQYSLVDDIYANSRLYDFEVTQSLVSLRKKGAIRVYNN